MKLARFLLPTLAFLGSARSSIAQVPDPQVLPIGADPSIDAGCQEFPFDQNVTDDLCSAHNVVGLVWYSDQYDPVEDRSTPETNYEYIKSNTKALLDGFSTLISSDCLELFLMHFCHSSMPRCQITANGGSAPRPVCRRFCTELWNRCDSFFEMVRNMNIAIVDDCDGTYGEESYTFRKSPFMHGKQVYPIDGISPAPFYSFDFGSGAVEEEVSCYDPRESDVQVETKDCLETQICPNPFIPIKLDEEANRCICGVTCPLPIWDSSSSESNLAAWKNLQLFYVLPGLLAIPFCMIVVHCEIQNRIKFRSTKRGRDLDHLIFLSGIVGLAYVFSGPIMSLYVGFDMLCDGREFAIMDTKEGSHGQLAISENGACHFNKCSINVLQVFAACVMCTLYRLRLKVKASKNMRRGDTETRFRRMMYALAIVVVPALSCMLCYTLDAGLDVEIDYTLGSVTKSSNYDLRMTDTIRNAFSCGYRFNSSTTELLLVSAPLLVYGFAAFAFAMDSMRMTRQLQKGISSSGKVKPSNDSMEFKLEKKISGPLEKLIITMARFSIACVIFLLANLIATITFIPKAQEFAGSIDTWMDCVESGGYRTCMGDYLDLDQEIPYVWEHRAACIKNIIPQEMRAEKCNTWDNFAPPAELLAIMFLGASALPFLFSFLFSWMFIKQQWEAFKRKTRSITGTSSASLSTSS